MKRQPKQLKRYSVYCQSSHGRYINVPELCIDARSLGAARNAAAHGLIARGYGKEGFAIVVPNDRPSDHPRKLGTASPIVERSFYVFPGQKPIRMMDVRDYARA